MEKCYSKTWALLTLVSYFFIYNDSIFRKHLNILLSIIFRSSFSYFVFLNALILISMHINSF